MIGKVELLQLLHHLKSLHMQEGTEEMQDNAYIGNEPPNEVTSQERTSAVRIDDLSHLIRSKRWAERLTLEELSKKIGVSAATLSRWERGGVQISAVHDQGASRKSVREPDTRTLAAMTRWLGVSIDRVVESEPSQRHIVEAGSGKVNTLDIVEAHLRADRNLDPQAAEFLARVFRMAYEQVSSSVNEPSPVVDNDPTSSSENEQDVQGNSEDLQNTKRGRPLNGEQDNEERR